MGCYEHPTACGPDDTGAFLSIIDYNWNSMFNYQVGDIVTRNLCGCLMQLKVTRVTDTCIECGPWVFDSGTGIEIDEELECIVSWLEPQKTSEQREEPTNA
jgi:hypothetical protein